MERLRNARSDYRKFRGFGGKIDTIQGQIEQAEQELSHAETEKTPLEQINSDVEDFQQKVYDFWVHFWGQIRALEGHKNRHRSTQHDEENIACLQSKQRGNYSNKLTRRRSK